MAYGKLILHRCCVCGKRASVEVFNNRDSSQGCMCPVHARERVEMLNRLESQPCQMTETVR